MIRAPFIVALLAVCLLVVSSPSYAQNPDLVSGVEKVDQADYTGAIADLEKAVNAQPQNEVAWYYLGVASYNTNQMTQALDALKRAVQLAPQRAGTRVYLGNVYEAQGNLNEAIRVYQEEVALSQGPALAETLVGLGRLYTRAGHSREAIDVLKHALDIDPNYVEALYEMGLAQSVLHQYTEAIATFNKATDILQRWSELKAREVSLTETQKRATGDSPEDVAQKYGKAEDFATRLGLWPQLNKTLGDTYRIAGKWSEARNAYRHAMIRTERGNPSDADAQTRIALAFLGDARSVFNDEGMLFGSIGVTKSAIKAAEQALTFQADYAPAYRALGLIYAFEANTYITDASYGVTSHSYQEAIDQFNKALQADPNYFDAMADVATVYLDWAQRLAPGSADQTKAYSETQSLLARAAKLNPTDLRVLVEQARLQLNLENYDAALRMAQEALNVDKNNVSALNTAGLAYYYQGRFGEAAASFTLAVTADSKNPQSYTNLGNTFFAMQSWYRARHEYRNALDHTPEARIANTAFQRAYLLLLTARTYHETHMYDEEIGALDQALTLDANYFDVYAQLGRAYTEKGQYRAAEQALMTALDKAYSDIFEAQVYTQMGQMYERKGDIHKAVQAYSSALTLDPNNTEARRTFETLQG